MLGGMIHEISLPVDSIGIKRSEPGSIQGVGGEDISDPRILSIRLSVYLNP
jgi:hypothetical protein